MSTLQEAPQDRIFTVPNILSLARLLGVPLFLWLVLIEADWWALGLLVFAGLSDWLDGKLARAFNQTSKLGMVLDPAADRLYILATLVGLTIRDIIPLWLVLALVAREVSILPIAPIVRRLGYGGTLPVHFIGKAATMCLLYSFPLLLLGEHGGGAGTAARVVGWAFAGWGTALYWWAAILYWVQTRQLVLAGRGAPPPSLGPDSAPEAEDPGDAGGPGAQPPAGGQKGAETSR
ncbi:CDP-alcohol phosphatidyltransferase family protein [Actinomadura luteofluorescens]|uniref:CDP-alcohol phosphatidyltransferase family protein n=1 Tax=Actinomadura luteofluorescens TaxID=46163 RepID=UPI003D92DC62